jgi:hypothetical protein
MSMSIRIRTPNSAETYQFELPSHLRTLGDLRAVLHHDAQRAASTSSLYEKRKNEKKKKYVHNCEMPRDAV